jgi:hypothetical protein
MPSWSEFAEFAPELAAAAKERFVAHRHCLLGTIRSDGYPRISGIEAHFFEDNLWLGMMPESVKGADLRRDPRFSLHSAPTDLDLIEGDAKLHGRAIEVDDATVAAFAASLPEEQHLEPPPPGAMELFRVDISDVSFVRVDAARELLVIDSWQAGDPAPRRRHR